MAWRETDDHEHAHAHDHAAAAAANTVVADTHKPLGQVVRDRDAGGGGGGKVVRPPPRSLASAILDVARHASARDSWIKSLEVLRLAGSGDDDDGDDGGGDAGAGGKRRRMARGGSVSSLHPPLLRRVFLDPVGGGEAGRDYVAVSYTWATATEEEEVNGGDAGDGRPGSGSGSGSGSYRVESRRAGQAPRPSAVRDGVWDRALRFAAHHGCRHVWLDRECVDPDDAEAREAAVQNMHLVYGLSRRPVALLARPVATAAELDLLVSLLLGDVRAGEAAPALALLDALTADRWWARAWTFQADHRAGARLTLLLPHRRGLEERKRAARDLADRPLLGAVAGEISVRSADFRRRATEFCLAHRRGRPAAARATCDRILRRAGQYHLLLRQEAEDAYAVFSRALSPNVFADVGGRGIAVEADRLAIVANCCGYATRLATPALRARGASLSVALLALYLLNGEVLHNHPRRAPGPALLRQCDVFAFLGRQALAAVRPPLDEDLTFLRSCRFVDPVLTPRGVRTAGHLWRLGPVLRRPRPMKLQRFRKQSPLAQFAAELAYPEDGGGSPAYAELACSIVAWQKSRSTTTTPPATPGKGKRERSTNGNNNNNSNSNHHHHQQRGHQPWAWREWMADEVEAALLEGKALRLASLVFSAADEEEDEEEEEEEEPNYQAIFVSDGPDDWEDEKENADNHRPAYVFTSVRPARPGARDDVHKHVSLEVDVKWPDGHDDDGDDDDGDGEKQAAMPMPDLYIRRWLNGLCFFEGDPRVDVVFPWPPALTA
ncbi:heterokaryon incompatibility protein-domain-containing protein [Xylariomycetidae sp. FL0641]|nr:heterokaryon incompatibility protein-domain-containing protein [Xylariomycetidae sp. FL0641]